MRSTEHFIDGKSQPSKSGKTLDAINPANGDVYAQVSAGSAEDVNAAVDAAKKASRAWTGMKPLQRGEILRKIADGINAAQTDLAAIETAEMGMPSEVAPGIISASAEFFSYYGGAGGLGAWRHHPAR